MEYRTTTLMCPTCEVTMPLDHPRQQPGEVRWEITQYWGGKKGKAVSFRCPNGHSSESDPQLLRHFPQRDF